jgi:O-antigen/teichoic acid export membrane protein
MILSTLFRPEYAASADVLVWTMLAAAISYVASFLGYGLTAARQFKIQAPLLVIVTLATAMASVILVPRHGLVGAAWAVVCGAAVKLIGGAFILRHVMRMRVERLELSVSDQPLPIRTVVLT